MYAISRDNMHLITVCVIRLRVSTSDMLPSNRKIASNALWSIRVFWEPKKNKISHRMPPCSCIWNGFLQFGLQGIVSPMSRIARKTSPDVRAARELHSFLHRCQVKDICVRSSENYFSIKSIQKRVIFSRRRKLNRRKERNAKHVMALIYRTIWLVLFFFLENELNTYTVLPNTQCVCVFFLVCGRFQLEARKVSMACAHIDEFCMWSRTKNGAIRMGFTDVRRLTSI